LILSDAELSGPNPAKHLSVWLEVSMYVAPLKQMRLFKVWAHS